MVARLESYKDRHGKVQQHWRVDFVFRHPDGRMERVREVSPVQTRRGSEQYERDRRQALLDGRYRKEAQQIRTLDVFAEDFMKLHAEANNKPSEVAKKRQILKKHILPILGRHRLNEVTRKDVDAYKRAKLAEGKKAKTVNNHLAVLSKMLGIAQEWEEISAAPKIRPLKVAPSEFRWLVEEDARKLVAAADAQWAAMVFTGLRTGLRMGELRALRWHDVDVAGGRLVVRQAAWEDEIGTPKGGRSREVQLGDEIRAALDEHPQRLRCELVFPGDDGGLRDTSSCVWALRRIGNAAGLGSVGWHVLRHTFASHLVQRGVTLAVVKELLGHADIRTTMRYSHLAPGAERGAVKLLDHVQPMAKHGAASGK